MFSHACGISLVIASEHHRHADRFENSEFILILAYMADIFDGLNQLNRQMHGGVVNIIEAEENRNAFKKKLPLWKRRTENENLANFPLLEDCLNKKEGVAGIEDIFSHGELKL